MQFPQMVTVAASTPARENVKGIVENAASPLEANGRDSSFGNGE